MAIQALNVNYLAVLVSAIVSMIIGFLWYGPLFGKPWMKLMNITPKMMNDMKKKGGMGKNYFVSFIASLIMAFVLAHAVAYAGATTIVEGLIVGFWNWLGFIAAIQLGIVLWEGKPVKLYLIKTLHYLTILLINGAILAVWV